MMEELDTVYNNNQKDYLVNFSSLTKREMDNFSMRVVSIKIILVLMI